jgi:L-fuculose-phosphate aldolase
MKFHMLPPRDQLVSIMDRIYHNGMTTLSGGNLSIRDDDGSIWITPTGVDKGSLRPTDIVRVLPDGAVEGLHRPSSELPFHRAIYTRRPDLKAVVHAHPPALVSFSIAREVPQTNIIPQSNRVVGTVGYAQYALPGSEKLGENIAATFADEYDAVLLENHGVAAGGSSLLDAFHRLETLDFCARTLIAARKIGRVSTLSDEQLQPFDIVTNDLPEFEPATHSSHERELRQAVVEIVHRACDRYLMISTEGVVSARLDDDSFLIIYVQHPDISCIITAQSPHATAYAITEAQFDTRTIPESYILLRDIVTMPYGAQYAEPEKIAEKVSLNQPVLLLQNDCVLTVGRSVLEAFDRLEVAEYSAHSLTDALALGRMVPIGKREISDLEEAFSLE